MNFALSLLTPEQTRALMVAQRKLGAAAQQAAVNEYRKVRDENSTDDEEGAVAAAKTVFENFVAQGNAILQLQLHAHYHLQIQLLIKQQGAAMTANESNDDEAAAAPYLTPPNNSSKARSPLAAMLGPSTPFEEQHAVNETISYYEKKAKDSPEMAKMARAASNFVQGQLSPVPNASERTPIVDLQLWNTWMSECVAALKLNTGDEKGRGSDGSAASQSSGAQASGLKAENDSSGKQRPPRLLLGHGVVRPAVNTNVGTVQALHRPKAVPGASPIHANGGTVVPRVLSPAPSPSAGSIDFERSEASAWELPGNDRAKRRSSRHHAELTLINDSVVAASSSPSPTPSTIRPGSVSSKGQNALDFLADIGIAESEGRIEGRASASPEREAAGARTKRSSARRRSRAAAKRAVAEAGTPRRSSPRKRPKPVKRYVAHWKNDADLNLDDE